MDKTSPTQPAAMLQPLSDEAWPAAAERLRSDFAGKLNVYRVMAHNPALLLAWEMLRNHVVRTTALPPDKQEIVILRAGHRAGADYEWAHHIVRGRAAGLSDDRIVAAGKPRADADLAGDALLLRAVDELFENQALSAATVSALQMDGGTHGMLDLMATVGMYQTLAFIVKSFGTPLDDDIRQELDRAPLS
jgi:4-carboxymuconolactone decarboxylase